MTADRPDGAPSPDFLQRSVAAWALGVLTLSSLVGAWMAILLLWPEAGAALSPLTYGRWAPLHLDLVLYGWCSLPAIGLLMRRLLPPGPDAARYARLALAAWAGALAAGALSWLRGDASGKIFLDWSGPAGLGFALAQLFLWSVLAAGWRERGRRGLDRPGRRLADAGLLLVLLFVPIALHVAADPAVFPPIDPDSGGATGHSLLASSLAVVGIALVLPAWLGCPRTRGGKRDARTLAGLFAANWVVYALIGHGDASNHDPAQIGGLGTLLAWPWLLAWWYRRHAWAEAHRPWLAAAAFWAVFLVLDGFVLFLPGVLERAKFTNALVGHSHLAMAGLLTSLNLLMLVSLAPGSDLARSLAGRRPWLAWNAACLLMVLVLTGLGWREGPWIEEGARPGSVVDAVYLVRLGSGLVMLGAAATWTRAALSRSAAAPGLLPSVRRNAAVKPAGNHAPAL